MAAACRRLITLAEVAQDFEISASCQRNSLRAADLEDGNWSGISAAESAEVRKPTCRNRPFEP